MLGLVVLAAGCGGTSEDAPPAWVDKANAFCRVKDPQIRKAEDIAGPTVIFSAFTVRRIEEELNGLARRHLFLQLDDSFRDAEKAINLLLRSSQIRRADSILLHAQRAAAAKGVHCSFGAVPLSHVDSTI